MTLPISTPPPLTFCRNCDEPIERSRDRIDRGWRHIVLLRCTRARPRRWWHQ